MKKPFISLLIIFILTLESFPLELFKNKIISLTDEEDRVIETIKTDDEEALRDAIGIVNKIGGVIYIDTPVINISSITSIILNGYSSGGIIGVKQENGQYPRIDFKDRREKMLDFSYVLSGLYIDGSHKYIKNLIIENSNNHGIEIRFNYNTIDHVITRYNAGSGIYINGNSNTLNYCYSYRNCNKKLNEENSDGFFFSKYNVNFNYCFAWDNLGNGFYNHVLTKISLAHSASWNNGNVNVFTGKYDYDIGKPLDKNIITIQDLINSDDNFENNYNKKNFTIDNGIINGINANEWISRANSKMDSDGFSFSTDSLTQEVNISYSIAFDNKYIGFNDKYAQVCPSNVIKCVSFNNKINYHLTYKFKRWEENWSFNPIQYDQIDTKEIIKKPSNIKSSEKAFYSIKDLIIKSVEDNTFPDNINFDKYINNLVE